VAASFHGNCDGVTVALWRVDTVKGNLKDGGLRPRYTSPLLHPSADGKDDADISDG